MSDITKETILVVDTMEENDKKVSVEDILDLAGSGLPEADAQDAGKVIKVQSDGTYGLGYDMVNPDELPDVTSADAGKILKVDSNGDWVIGEDSDRKWVTAGKDPRTDYEIGNNATVEGVLNDAPGNYAHSEGQGTLASGIASHAEGYGSKAYGDSSHSEGRGTTARGSYSHAEGAFTKANKKSQHVFGEYNTAESGDATVRGTYIEIVGNGDDSDHPSNARTLDWAGNEWVRGNIRVGGDRWDSPRAILVATQSDITKINRRTTLIRKNETNSFTNFSVVLSLSEGMDIEAVLSAHGFDGGFADMIFRLESPDAVAVGESGSAKIFRLDEYSTSYNEYQDPDTEGIIQEFTINKLTFVSADGTIKAEFQYIDPEDADYVDEETTYARITTNLSI